MSRSCPFCNSSEIDEDPSRGDATCMNCGTVLEESRIVADVQFQETSGGQFVSADRSRPGAGGVPGVPKSESREVTYFKGKKLIQEIASQLRINNHCVNTAYNFFKMCVSRNFTRGRVRSHVVAACLYMTCRLENTSHLLLDFSDITQVNVFDLGRTLNFLTRSLKINLPTTDPCLYVLRFAIMLDFKDKQKDIVSLATRIVQRMKRDWMSTGRRPTGICGAALLLACRAYNVNRGISDIVRVVHISETVVRKRLDEFASTPSGSLTIDEFHVVDLEESEDPPAFQMTKQRTKELRQEEEKKADAVTRNLDSVQKEVEEALKQKMKKSPYAKFVVGSVKDISVPELAAAANVVQSELLDTVYQVAEDRSTVESEDVPVMCGPSLKSLGIVSDTRPSSRMDEPESTDNGELDLAGIDDDEIDSYILSKEESELKSEVWMLRNGVHLEEIERKRKIRMEEEAKERENPTKRRRKAAQKKTPINAANHSDAMLQVIQEKKLSNKINYDILKEIEASTPIPKACELRFEINNTCITDEPSTSNVEHDLPSKPLPTSPVKETPAAQSNAANVVEKSPSVSVDAVEPVPKIAQSVPSVPTVKEQKEPPAATAPKVQSRYKRNMIRPKAVAPKPSNTS